MNELYSIPGGNISRDGEREEGGGGGEGADGEDDDDAKSICTIILHELESVEEEDEEMARQEQQKEEERRRRVDLARLRTPEPTGFGMTAHHLPLDDDGPRQQPSLPNASSTGSLSGR